MTRPDIARAINATVEPLSDIARSNNWRRIEQAITEPAPPRHASRALVVGGMCAAALAAAALAVVLGVGRGSSSSSSVRTSESLVAANGQRLDRTWSGGELTLYGPGAAQLLRDGEHRITVIVSEGTAVVRRDRDSSEVLSVHTPSLATDVTSEVFAVRVVNGATVMATGDAHVETMLRGARVLEPRGVGDAAHGDGVRESESEGDGVRESDGDGVRDSEGEGATEGATRVLDATGPRRPRRVKQHSTAPVHELETADDSPALDSLPVIEEPEPASAPSLDEIYATAEDALRRGDSKRAAKLLEIIVRDDPEGRLAASARYDLALLALDREQYQRALKLVDAIISAGSDPNLVQPARLLRCRIRTAQGAPCDD